jgi:hypothetical protein
MALRYRQEGGRRMTVMESCPFCGHEFSAPRDRVDHFLDEHGPEVVPDV